MGDKTLGQVAEHAYDSCPDSDEDVCWQAVAAAVAEAALEAAEYEMERERRREKHPGIQMVKVYIMTNFVLEAVASLARLAVHFDDSDRGDGMRNLAVKARQQHDAERAVIKAAKAWADDPDEHMALRKAVRALEAKEE